MRWMQTTDMSFPMMIIPWRYPTEGSFKNSITLDNAIRFSDVFENIDFQYTVLGDTVKEDIIVLERQGRNEFAYKLKAGGLKFKKVGNSVVGYKES